jgi:predicted flap endonuclease-1-like 5' DNA nuclease
VAETKAEAEPAPAPAAKPAPKPAAEKPAEPKAEKKAEPKAAAKPAAKPESKPSAKPAKAAKAKPDDLKQIKGVGPKLEQLLHENGITQFSQIAAWGEAEIDEFAEKIGSMGGRIRSDDWIAQAKTLAEGGSTEFASRVKKGDVY